MSAVHFWSNGRSGWSFCRFIQNPVTTQDQAKVTCLACIKKLNDIPHTTSLVNQTKTVLVPLHLNRTRPLQAKKT